MIIRLIVGIFCFFVNNTLSALTITPIPITSSENAVQPKVVKASLNSINNQKLIVKAAILPDVYADLLRFLDGRDIYSIKSFGGENSGRSVAEIVVFAQALKLGGIDAPVEWVLLPERTNHIRVRKEVEVGRASVSASTYFSLDLKKDNKRIYVSEPLSFEGEFEAGFFYPEGREITIRNREDLKKLTVVSNPQWISDRLTLEELPLNKIIDAYEYATIIKLIMEKRADFMLSTFTKSKDMGFYAFGYHFLPVKGVKVSLKGSRHFIISARDPNALKILKALNVGLSKMRANGTLMKALTESGFINSRVKGWKNLSVKN